MGRRIKSVREKMMTEARMASSNGSTPVPVGPEHLLAANPIVVLNVGGRKFSTRAVTLLQQSPGYRSNATEPIGLLGELLLAQVSACSLKSLSEFPYKSVLFIDRDPTHFRYVLNFLRTGPSTALPQSAIFLREMMEEAKFYRLPHLSEHIAKRLASLNQPACSALGKAVRSISNSALDDLAFTQPCVTGCGQCPMTDIEDSLRERSELGHVRPLFWNQSWSASGFLFHRDTSLVAGSTIRRRARDDEATLLERRNEAVLVGRLALGTRSTSQPRAPVLEISDPSLDTISQPTPMDRLLNAEISGKSHPLVPVSSTMQSAGSSVALQDSKEPPIRLPAPGGSPAVAAHAPLEITPLTSAEVIAKSTAMRPFFLHPHPASNHFTWEEIRKHNSAKSCWLVVRNRVFDVTCFLGKHPAGDKIILQHGGKDCTVDFDFHSRIAQDMWRAHEIGRVKSGTGCVLQ